METTEPSFQERYHRLTQHLSVKYEPVLREHLAKVYMVLGSTIAATAVGSLLQMMNIINFRVLAGFAGLILVLALHICKDNGKNNYARLAMLFSFGFCSGQSLGPLLSFIAAINPAVISTAFAGAAITFMLLSLAALTAERAKYLYLGFALIILINAMIINTLFNSFFQSNFIQSAQLYFGVFIMADFIVFDTQILVEKYHYGNRDIVLHALDLYFDLLSLFRRLLIILSQKEQRLQRKECHKKNP